MAEKISGALEGVHRLSRRFQDWFHLVLQQVDQGGDLNDQDDQRRANHEGFQRHENDKHVAYLGGDSGSSPEK